MPSSKIPSSLQETFTEVDDYITTKLISSHPASKSLTSTLEVNKTSNLDAIDVSPPLGSLLYQLALLTSATRILEVGTLGGYSAIWLAQAVSSKPDGKVISLEIDPRHAEVARGNLRDAGLQDVVEVRVGEALNSLEEIRKERKEAKEEWNFDFVFIDADKVNNLEYFNFSLEFARKGSLIVVDNVVRRGRLVDPDTDDPSVEGTRRLFDFLDSEEGRKRVVSTALQTVGSKGWDGFLLATVL